MGYYKVDTVIDDPDGVLASDEADDVRGHGALSDEVVQKVKAGGVTFRPEYRGSRHYCKTTDCVPRQFLILADSPPFDGAQEIITNATLRLYGVPV